MMVKKLLENDTDDPGEFAAKFEVLCSPHPHTRILSTETSSRLA
jgi:hypothetical protein